MDKGSAKLKISGIDFMRQFVNVIMIYAGFLSYNIKDGLMIYSYTNNTLFIFKVYR